VSETESFLGRWSRLKRDAVADPRREPPEPECPPAAEEAAPEPFDPNSLPPVSTLTAGSDYKPFLARGVPEELRRLALRRAWVTDPRIAGFRGFADYDWDCNAPGYGQLLPVDDIKRLCDALLRPPAEENGSSPDSTEPTAPAPAAETAPDPDSPAVEHNSTAAVPVAESPRAARPADHALKS
jgi:Protein of unknown function (DUF3306)